MTDKWEFFLDSYPSYPDMRSFGKALQCAKAVLQQDIAPFEIEWILESLLYNPVNLITKVELNYLDETWTQPISEALKLLKDVVEKHEDHIKMYLERIVAICNLPLSGNACKNSLSLLKEVSCISPLPSDNLRRHLSRISEGAIATTQRVALIGAICKHNPESATDFTNDIWRTLLNLLDSNKNTVTLNCVILQAIHDMFIHFGTGLPVIECNAFYHTIVDKYLDTKCQNVCLQILSNHYELFIEHFARDRGTRAHLWDLLKDSSCGEEAVTAVKNAYKAVCKVERGCVESIITAEVSPQTYCKQTRVKYTALRILTYCNKECPSISIDNECMGNVPDELNIEFEMRNGSVSHDVAEAVSWCLEANVPNAANILHTAILFIDHLPAPRGKEIVKQAVLKAHPELRYTAVTFLTNESIQSDEVCMERYFHTWQTLLDSDNGKDCLVVEKSGDIFRDFVTYSRLILDVFLEDNLESLPPRITNLLNLTCDILSLQTKDEHVTGLVSILTPVLVGIARRYECAEAVRALTRARGLLDDIDIGFDDIINLSRCRDEPTLCAMCEAVIDSPSVTETNKHASNEQTRTYIDNTLSACRIVFGRNDVDPNTMSKGLIKLGQIIEHHGISYEDFDQISSLLDRQRNKPQTSKESRIFHKDLIMFMAKYRCHKNLVNERKIMFKLNEGLCMNLPEIRDGVNHLMNLSEILGIAILNEDHTILQTLLTVICANLQTTPKLSCYALPRTILALCRAYSRCIDQTDSCQIMTQLSNVAVDNVDCVAELIRYVTIEPSPGVRQIISDIMERALLEDQTGDLLVTTIESTIAMLTDEQFKKAGLDVSETILSGLKENSHNSITKTYLPQILHLISKTNEIHSENTFEFGAKVYMEKIELFHDTDILDFVKSLMAGLVTKNDGSVINDKSVTTYKKTVKVVLFFVKNIFDYKKNACDKLLGVFFEIYDNRKCNFKNILYVLSEMHTIFDLNIDLSRKILSHNQYSIQSQLFCMDFAREDDQTFCMEAVLKFMTEFAVILLELQYQKSLELLGRIIVPMLPTSVISLHKTVKSCLTAYKRILKSYPKILLSQLEEWCQKRNLDEVTKCINKYVFEDKHANTVKSLKLMLMIYQLTDLSTLTDVCHNCQAWPLILLKLYSKGHIDQYYMSKVPYLTDVMIVAVQFMNVTDVKSILLEGHDLSNVSNEKVGMRFCKYFMSAFCDRLCQTPYVLLEYDMKPCVELLYDIVKYVCWKHSTDKEKENVMDLINQLWPTYIKHTTFSQQCDLLLNINTPTWPAWTEGSNPLVWAGDVLGGRCGAAEQRAKVIASVKGGDAFSDSYMTVASSLPTRFSEFKGTNQAILRAMIDALSSTGNDTLLNIICSLAGGDQTKGWWDTAIDACMASIQSLQHVHNIHVLDKVYNHCFNGTNSGVVERVLAPLLRYSTSLQCEKFFTSKVKDLYKKLKQIKGKTDRQMEILIADITRSFLILQVGFEKLPVSSLESPSSAINQALGGSKPWNLVIRVCMAASTLRDNCKGYKETASQETKPLFRKFHCANYNCLAAAICKWKPHKVKIYEQLYDPAILDLLVDDVTCYLPLYSSWSRRTKRRPVSIELPATSRDVNSVNTSLNTSYGTLTSQHMRSRLFLRTLSENPLQFDLIDHSQELQTQEIDLTENVLNSHECATTLTALFRTCDCFADHMGLVASALVTGRLNVKLIVAQTICNSREELMPHAISLRAALLDFIVNTPVEYNGKSTLNQLHIDVMETILYWIESNPVRTTELDTVLSLLLTTCMENKEKTGVVNTLLDLLKRWLDMYGSASQVEWNVFEPYLGDHTKQAKGTILKLLSRICKTKQIFIPQLLPTLLTKLEKREDLTETSQLFGLAVNCQTDMTALSKFRSILHGLKSNSPAEYVKVLFYAQMGCVKVCDDRNFRLTVDQVLKQVGPERKKCFQILTSYVTENIHSDSVVDMFDTIALCDVISGDNLTDVKSAMELVKAGFQVIPAQLKRRVVNVITDRCTHNDTSVSSAACDIVLMDFKDLIFSTKTTEPATKRQKTDTSPLIRVIQTHDVEYAPIIRVLSVAVATNRIQAAELLSSELRMRFKECFLLTVELPIKQSTNSNTLDLSFCTSTFIQLLFSDLRSQELFRNVKLREHGLEISQNQSINITQPLKLLSGTRTYQGTFSKTVKTSTRMKLSNSMTNVMTQNTAINVTISIDEILGEIIEFAKQNASASCALISELARTLKVSGFDAACVHAGPLTLLALSVMDKCHFDNTGNRLMQSLECLKETTKQAEAESLVKYLYRNIQIDSLGEDQFILGRNIKQERDSYMKTDEFSLEGLTEAFGQLSNWNQLTVQEKRDILESGVTPLWTDSKTFADCIERHNVTDSKHWFGKLVLAYRQHNKQDTLKWLRELDLFPRCYFNISATGEAIDWSTNVHSMYKADVQDDDCLAAWAARLMTRKAFIDSVTHDEEDETSHGMLSRSHELQWCERAIEMGLGMLNLDCVKRNVVDMYRSETLSWLWIQAAGLRAKGLETSDHGVLTKALVDAENNLPEYANYSTSDVVLAMYKLILELYCDLNSLSTQKLQSYLEESIATYQSDLSRKTDPKFNRDMADICVIAMGHYCDMWDENEESHESILQYMTDVASKVSNIDSKLSCQCIDAILCKLDDVKDLFTDELAKSILDLVQNNIEKLDEFSLEQLKSHSTLFPSHLLSSYPCMSEREDNIVMKYKQCFHLLCDPEYSLLSFCNMLIDCLKKRDKIEWSKTFKRMKEILFENNYAGSDYLLLNKFKESLYEIENSDTPTQTSTATLQTILNTLSMRKIQTVLKLSQLCPALASGVERDTDIITKMLGISGTKVISFDEHMQVFTDSVRRPVILRARTADGHKRQYLVKLGDELYGDAAAMRVATSIGGCITTYQVTPISEDCGLIEYLEDYQRLRALVSQTCDLSVAEKLRQSRPPDYELVLSQPRVASLHTSLTALVPACTLRNAIHSVSVEIEDSVALMVVFGWILGLGDRHLENILYSIQDGRFCCVDWAAILQYGVGELPPARLTRNIVAACDVKLLESRMQRLLSRLRKSSGLLLTTIQVAFRGLGTRFQEKFPYMKSILNGESTSYHVTKDAILHSKLKHKEKYVELLDDVFKDVENKTNYSVEEQISVLLRQCTDPKILSVTRSGWEPWI